MKPKAGSAHAWVKPGGIEIELAPGRDDLSESTRFEVGSIVKTMTATLLAGYVVDGTVGLDDPIGRWIDAGRCSEVTLGALATHSSGLPRLPPRMRWSRRFRPENPYANYRSEHLPAALQRTTVRDPGGFAYSNFGYLVLGHALSVIGGASFETLLCERVLVPAGVSDVTFGGDDGVVPGYSNERSVPHWDHVLGGAGGARASIADLARWVAANLAPPDSLRDAMLLAQQKRAGVNGFGWMLGVHDPAVRWHNGGTGGFSSFCGFAPERGVGVALLTNAANANSALDRAGLAALSGE